MNARIVCDSEEARILTINNTDLFTILSEQEIYSFLSFPSCIKFPEDSEIVREISEDLQQAKLKKQLLDLTKSVLKKNNK